MRERSQFGRFRGGLRGGYGGDSGFGAGAVEFVVGAVPGAFEGGDLALDAEEEFGGGRLGEECSGERATGRFGHDGAVEIGLDDFHAALEPVGAEHGVHVERFGGGLGAVLVAVVGGEGFVFGGVFAGDDGGSGVDAVFEGVETGGGLAFGRTGAGGLLGVTGLYNSFEPIPFVIKARVAA